MVGRFRYSPIAAGLICCFVLYSTNPVQGEILVGVVDQHSPESFWGSKGERASELAYRPLDRTRLQQSALALVENEEAIEAFAVWLAVLQIPPSWIYDHHCSPCPAPTGSNPTSSTPPGGSDGPGSEPPPPLNTPEPGTLLLGTVGAGLIGLIRWRRKRCSVAKNVFFAAPAIRA